MSHPRVQPKLVVGRYGADAAIAFYEAVLGARLLSRYTMGVAVVFAQLELPGGAQFQVKDADSTDAAPPASGGVLIDLVCDDPDAVARAALDHGAQMIFPVADQPYGARQGRFRDPAGHQWLVGTPITMSGEEIQAALDAGSRKGRCDG